MIQAYSKRLLSPYTGQVQVVESERARALTLDGSNWEVQYRLELHQAPSPQPWQAGETRAYRYIRVAIVRPGGIEPVPTPPILDPEDVNRQVVEVARFLEEVELPLPAADSHEYWLLDEADEQPLALIYSCVHAQEMPSFPHRPEWTATPASIMKIAPIPEEEQHYVPPVNYRLEQLVNRRAGRRPRARWIRRRQGLTEQFPSLLVREDWDRDEDRLLCQRYIQRQAPRLLMLQGLGHDVRLRLEGFARAHALEVERFFHLYPEVADNRQMSAIRLEARLRLAAGDKA